MCCSSSWIWTAIMFAFTIGDIAMGGATLYYWFLAFSHFPYILRRLDQQNYSHDVAYYGFISVLLVAIVCVCSGLKLLCKLHKAKPEDFRSYLVKFFIYFIVELVGFGAPFYIFKEYMTKINFILTCTPDVNYTKFFHLLLINPVTIGIFIYQILSMLVAYKFIKSVKEKGQKRLPRSRRPPTSDGHGISATSWVEVETARPQPKSGTENRTNHHSLANTGNPRAPNRSSSGGTVYPNVENLRQDLDLPPGTVLSAVTSLTLASGPCYNPKSAFQQLKANCLKSGILFEDPNFPANEISLQIPNNSFQWKRPYEIAENPQFITDGATRFDVNQGKLGNCWFLAAVANLTLHDGLFAQVVPRDNIWTNRSNYAGIFHFRFWCNGTWKDVIVDDRLPTQNGRLVFMQSKDANEFWSCLLEKAYAKLHGNYQKLVGGRIGIAMSHLTSGQVESIHPKGLNSIALFGQMKSALDKGCLLGCSIYKTKRLHIADKGLVTGHAYSVTGVKMVQMKSKGQIGLIRIRNPWGNYKEWSGDWSDGHVLWNQVQKKTRRELQLIFKKDGEFWFPISEFFKYFDNLEICYLN